jgi:hypothetical protein
MTIHIEATDTDFKAGHGTYRQNNTSFFTRIIDAWKDMPASTRRLIAEHPSEARLLFFVLLSDLIFFLSFSVKTVVSPTSIAQSALPDDVALLLVVALMVRTGSIYAFSFILGLILRAFGGTGTLKDTRAGVFWGSFVSAPFEVLAAILAVSMASMEGAMPFLSGETLSLAPLWLGLLPYIWFVSAGATAAHGFKRFYPLFAALSLLCIVGMFWALYLRANGVI